MSTSAPHVLRRRRRRRRCSRRGRRSRSDAEADADAGAPAPAPGEQLAEIDEAIVSDDVDAVDYGEIRAPGEEIAASTEAEEREVLDEPGTRAKLVWSVSHMVIGAVDMFTSRMGLELSADDR